MPYTETQIIGSLLAGGSKMFGQRVELAWPDGLPPGWTEGDLRDIGRRYLSSSPAWVSAEARYCRAPSRCGLILDADGNCEAHGAPVPPSLPAPKRAVMLPPGEHVTETFKDRVFCAGCTLEREWFILPGNCRFGPRPVTAGADG